MCYVYVFSIDRQINIKWLDENKIEYIKSLETADEAEYYMPLIKYHSSWSEYPGGVKFLFPLIASVSNDNRSMLKNAFLIGTHYLFATILVFAVHFAVFFVVVAWFTPLIILGEGLCAMISAWLLNNILIICSGTPEGVEEEDT